MRRALYTEARTLRHFNIYGENSVQVAQDERGHGVEIRMMGHVAMSLMTRKK